MFFSFIFPSIPHCSLPFLSLSFNAPRAVNLPGSECLETMHQSLHKERASRLLSSCSPVGLAAAPCSGLSRQQPDPRTTVRLPGAKSSNDHPLPLKHCQGHTGTERPANTRVLTGTDRGGGGGGGQNHIFSIFQRCIEGYLSVIHNNHLFKFNRRRSL